LKSVKYSKLSLRYSSSCWTPPRRASFCTTLWRRV